MSITTNDRIIANRGCSMKVIDEFLNNKQEQGQLAISLCGKLEGIVGNYFVSQVTNGIFDGLWYSVYCDPSVDYLKEAIKRDRNLIGYVDKYIRWAFILDNRSQKFKEDTAEYGLTYIEVPSFEQEILQCHHPDDLPSEFADILWIDDSHVAFFIYKVDAYVLRTPYGEFQLSSEMEVPHRLHQIIEIDEDYM